MEDLKPNQRTITRFLSELMRDWDASETLEVRCIGENVKPHASRFAQHATNEAIEHIVAMNHTHNVYACVNPVPDIVQGSAKDADIQRAFYAFVDGDEKGAADRAREFDWFDQAMEVVTGIKPFFRNHIYYRFNCPMEDMRQWTELQKLLIAELKTDKVIHNPSRIMRIAGTVTHPPRKKRELGYTSEVTKLIIGGQYVE
jgi:hypothetical protein